MKLGGLILVFLFSIFLVIAQEGSGIDYNSPTTYNDLSFWSNSNNLDKVNWEMVNFNTIPEGAWERIDQVKVPSYKIKDLPPEKIDVTKVMDKTEITSDQWKHGENLNKAEDLSSYPAAQKAVQEKHSLSEIDLSQGQTIYQNGKISNGGVPEPPLNLNKLNGAEIIALAGGGFSIGKGTGEGEFKVGENKFNLKGVGPKKLVEIRAGGITVLPEGAIMVDKEERVITSMADGTRVEEKGAVLNIIGKAIIKDGKMISEVGSSNKPGSISFGDTLKLKENSAVNLFLIKPEDETSLSIGEHYFKISDGSLTVRDETRSNDLELAAAEFVKGIGEDPESFGNFFEGLRNYDKTSLVKTQFGVTGVLAVAALSKEGFIGIGNGDDHAVFLMRDGLYLNIFGKGEESATVTSASGVDRINGALGFTASGGVSGYMTFENGRLDISSNFKEAELGLSFEYKGVEFSPTIKILDTSGFAGKIGNLDIPHFYIGAGVDLGKLVPG